MHGDALASLQAGSPPFVNSLVPTTPISCPRESESRSISNTNTNDSFGLVLVRNDGRPYAPSATTILSILLFCARTTLHNTIWLTNNNTLTCALLSNLQEAEKEGPVTNHTNHTNYTTRHPSRNGRPRQTRRNHSLQRLAHIHRHWCLSSFSSQRVEQERKEGS